jgi:hypothetical protein
MRRVGSSRRDHRPVARSWGRRSRSVRFIAVGDAQQQPRLAEVIGILAMATDLGIGVPMEHTVRTCLLSLELGRHVGLSRVELVDLHDLTLLRMLGCTAGSADAAAYFGDELAFGRNSQHLDYGDPEGFGRWVMESFGADREPAERERMVQKLYSYTPENRRDALAGHCEVAKMLAVRLGFSGHVIDGLAFVFERWDGTGAPNGIPGADLPIGVRVMSLCNDVETHHRLHGSDAAVTMARKRSGTAFDPALVEAFCRDAESILAIIEPPAAWERLLAAEPQPHRLIDSERLVEAARVMGDFADLKSAHLAGHSSGVANLAAGHGLNLSMGQSRSAQRVGVGGGAVARLLLRANAGTRAAAGRRGAGGRHAPRACRWLRLPPWQPCRSAA